MSLWGGKQEIWFRMLKRYVITFNHVINYEVVGTKAPEIPARCLNWYRLQPTSVVSICFVRRKTRHWNENRVFSLFWSQVYLHKSLKMSLWWVGRRPYDFAAESCFEILFYHTNFHLDCEKKKCLTRSCFFDAVPISHLKYICLQTNCFHIFHAASASGISFSLRKRGVILVFLALGGAIFD